MLKNSTWNFKLKFSHSVHIQTPNSHWLAHFIIVRILDHWIYPDWKLYSSKKECFSKPICAKEENVPSTMYTAPRPTSSYPTSSYPTFASAKLTYIQLKCIAHMQQIYDITNITVLRTHNSISVLLALWHSTLWFGCSVTWILIVYPGPAFRALSQLQSTVKDQHYFSCIILMDESYVRG